MLCFKLIFILSCSIWMINGAKILAIFSLAGYSQWLPGNRLLQELAGRGHEVTMISAFEQKPPIKNYKDIVIPEISFDSLDFQATTLNQKNVFERLAIVSDICYNSTEKLLNSKKIQDFLKTNQHFDLIIVPTFFNEAIRGFQHHFKAPVVGINPIGASHWVNDIMANPSSSSYIPDIMSKFSDKMTFLERLANSFIAIYTKLYHHLYLLPKHNELLHKYFPDAPHIYDLIYNTSLVFLNSHISTNHPVPLVPNLIEIGGYHIAPPKELPTDIKTYLDNAKDGVIYFSLGSFFKSKYLSNNLRSEILTTFSQLKQKVLWKFEDDSITNLPENVMIRKWLPQEDILAHPNVKLFITHGGLLSTIETIYHGKPIIGIPLFGDQDTNMAIAIGHGYGVAVPFKELSHETLSGAIKEIFTNPKYSETVQLRSRIMKDQQVQPLDKAIYWIEYVIRYNGAEHFHSSALYLNWYQYYLLDVALFVFILFYLIYTMMKLIFRLLFKKKSNVNQKKKKN